ncbi:MAG: beta-L-arabinofuranosidase domain-containing protein [Steroidobacteraceae bacterium]
MGIAAAEPLRQLGYGQVQLAAGPVQRQARENHLLVLALDENALLRPYRIRAGLAAPGHDLGGWYGTNAFAPGANFGQWLSALSRFYAITSDVPTQDKVHRLVCAYAATLESEGRFYQNNRFPAYTFDKLVGGLVDARMLAHDAAALSVLERTTQIAVAYLPAHAMARDEHSKPGEDFSKHAWDESYTLPENQFFAWHLTGDDRHCVLARRFLYDEFFSPLANGDNVLPGKHAYSHVNALSSAAQAYLSLGSPMYLQAARHGFAMIDAQSYATGGWGPDEHFIVPGSGALGASLTDVRNSFETPCGAYAHFKLTRYLLRITRETCYGDSMERVLYNTVLGAMPIQSDGRAFYYSDYTRHAKKRFHWDHWHCCSGTLPMIAADYAISTCFTDANGIYVNLYVPARVTWRQDNTICCLSIRTDYPYSSAIALTMQAPGGLTFTLNLRIPAWAAGASVRVNGRREQPTPEPGTFAAIQREWRAGDLVELELPVALRLQSVDAAHPDTVAMLAGPLVLMRVLGEDGTNNTPLTRTALGSAQRFTSHAHDWQIKRVDKALKWRPFIDIREETYSVYQDVLPA